MPTHWTVILGLTCDRCGQFLSFEGKSKPEVLKAARADGKRRIACVKLTGEYEVEE